MVSFTPFTLILSILAGVLVGAIPQHQQRDDRVCVDHTTITVTAPAAADSTTPPDAVVTITRTVTVVQTVDSVPEETSDNGVTETVTVFSTETSTVTVQAPLETKISDPTTEPQESQSPEPAPPSPPIAHPQYGDATQPVPYGNSSLPSTNSSSALPHTPVLPKPSSTADLDASSGYALPVSSGYENSLYFTNWLVFLLTSPLTGRQTKSNQGYIWCKLPAAITPCLQNHSCVLCVRLIWQ